MLCLKMTYGSIGLHLLYLMFALNFDMVHTSIFVCISQEKMHDVVNKSVSNYHNYLKSLN